MMVFSTVSEMSRLRRLEQGSVPDVCSNDPVNVESLQVRHLPCVPLRVEAIHSRRRQLRQLAGGGEHAAGICHAHGDWSPTCHSPVDWLSD